MQSINWAHSVEFAQLIACAENRYKETEQSVDFERALN